MGVLRMVARGLALRCPACGRGRIFRTTFTENASCPSCGRAWFRDGGDWTGGAEIALVLDAGALVLLLVQMRRFAPDASPLTQLAVLAGVAAILVPFTYRHVKGAWMAVVLAWEGPDPRPSPVSDPEWFTELWEAERSAPQWEEPPTTRLGGRR